MKKILVVLTIMLAVALPTSAQVFMMEDDMNMRTSEDAEDPYILTAGGLEFDQTNWTPVGNGVLLFAAFGGLYLLKKKRKSNKT